MMKGEERKIRCDEESETFFTFASRALRRGRAGQGGDAEGKKRVGFDGAKGAKNPFSHKLIISVSVPGSTATL
jgi:hypothetical protein